MSKPKRVEFKPLGSEFTKWGEFTVGQDGTLLYTSHSVLTGEPVTVVLYTDIPELVATLTIIDQLSCKHRDCAKRMEEHETKKVDLSPSKRSFQKILDSLNKPGKLH